MVGNVNSFALLTSVLALLWSLPAAAQSSQRVVIAAVGDVAPGEPQEGLLQKDWQSVLGVTAEPLRQADVAFANLEAPLPPADAKPWPRGSLPLLVGKPELAATLAKAGFDVVSLANNHVFDYHRVGVDGTLAAVERAGLAHTGLGVSAKDAEKPAILLRNGVRIGFIAATDRVNRSADAGADRAVVAWLNPAQLQARIRELRPHVDIVVVSLHWGLSYHLGVLESQRRIAAQLVEAGADLILGSHPHVLEPVEQISGVPVAFSLGNFLFGGQQGDRGRTLVLQAEFSVTPGRTRPQLVAVRCLPAVVNAQRQLVAPSSAEDLAAFAEFRRHASGCAQ